MRAWWKATGTRGQRQNPLAHSTISRTAEDRVLRRFSLDGKALALEPRIVFSRCASQPRRRASRLVTSHLEAVDTRGVLTGHLAQDFGAMQRQRRLGQCLARMGPGTIAVRVVRGPHDIVDPDALNQLD